MTWDQYYRIVAEAAGVAEPKLVHIASDLLAGCMPETAGSLLGDKGTSVVFDNSKIKRFVPDFQATKRYGVGIRETLAWFDADAAPAPGGRSVPTPRWDKLIDAYEAFSADLIARFRE